MDITCLKPSSESMTLAMNERCRSLEASGKEIFRFGFGQSPFPPVPAAVEEMKNHTHRKEYAPVAGLPELREAVADFHNELNGTSFTPDHVFLGPGCKQLIFNLMMCFTRLNVFIPAPAWVSYVPQARLIGHPVVRVETNPKTHRMTAETLESALQNAALTDAPKLLILNNPGNPDGQLDDEEALVSLAAVCQRHDVIVISDEIYGLLTHLSSAEHVCFAKLYPKCVVLSGLSKWCGAGGWRIGAAMFTPALDAMIPVFTGIASETYSCLPTPVQLAAVAAYQVTPELRNYLSHQRKFLSYAGLWAAGVLRSAGLRVNDPQAAFYLWVDFSPLAPHIEKKLGLVSSDDFFMRVLSDTGVAVLSGTAFGMHPHHLVARLAYVTFDGASVLQFMETLGDAAITEAKLRVVAPRLVDGIEGLAAYARQLTDS